jgi:hypothetical protein
MVTGWREGHGLSASQMVPYSSKVVHYIGNRVAFGENVDIEMKWMDK